MMARRKLNMFGQQDRRGSLVVPSVVAPAAQLKRDENAKEGQPSP